MIAYLDCTTGISGDKFLAALVDAGAPADVVREATAAVEPSIAIAFEPVMRAGIQGLAVSVTSPAEGPSHAEEPVHAPHAHRTWRSIRALLADSSLSSPVRETALAAFALLAEAEAAVHGTAVEDVHFHEVGAADSIADIVGSAAALHALGIDTLVCGPVATGSGLVETAHGTLPVPAPATALLLKGVPIEQGPLPGEATTPTGAALVRACAHSFGPLPPMTLRAVGHGAGSRDPAGVANVARLFVGAASAHAGADAQVGIEHVVELETAIDHLSAEHLAFCCEELRSAGALDVWQVAAVMKKGRAGTLVTAICHPEDAARLSALFAELTGSLGIRARNITRTVVPREERAVETSLGAVRVKAAGSGDTRRVRVEYEDLAAIARREGLPVDVVARRLACEIDADFRE